MHASQGHVPVAMKLQRAAHVAISRAQAAMTIEGRKSGSVPPQLAALERGAKAAGIVMLLGLEMTTVGPLVTLGT